MIVPGGKKVDRHCLLDTLALYFILKGCANFTPKVPSEQALSADIIKNNNKLKMALNKKNCESVYALLRAGWTPTAIAGHLKVHGSTVYVAKKAMAAGLGPQTQARSGRP